MSESGVMLRLANFQFRTILGSPAKNAGFTLLELMVTVAIIAIVAAVALPVYQNYITTSREGKLISNISTMEVFQEDLRLQSGSYTECVYAGDCDDGDSLEEMGWIPNDDATFVIDDKGSSYDVTGTDEMGVEVCLTLPDKTSC